MTDSERKITDGDFYWLEKNGLRLLVSRSLEDAGFVNGFSTRLGGVSPFPKDDLNLAGFGEDTEENIAENRRRFLTLFEGEYSITTSWQVHGNSVRAIRTIEDAAVTGEHFDSVVSDLRGLLVGVKTADCVPILIGDKKTGAYCAVHAGWRGSLGLIAYNAVEKLASEYGSEPAELICAIGPAASGRSYEVGPEVVSEFNAKFSTSGNLLSATANGHALVDLQLANRQQLIRAGVPPQSISAADYCTMERTDLFFSYRIEKKTLGRTGRLMSVIGQRQ